MPRLRPAPGAPARALPLLATLGVGGYAALTIWAISSLSYDVAGPLLIVPVLVAISLPVLRRVANGAPELTFGLLVLALAAKLVSALVRYLQVFVLYGGGGDSARYSDAGERIATALHGGLAWQAIGPFPGTAFIEGFTGYVYFLMGPSLVGGFFFYSWLGFWGLLLFQRAFATALPGFDTRRYALLVLFLPSLLFWPSAIGKEAWMTLCLGLGAYGAARLFARLPGGFLALALAIGGVSLVRPHMAALLFGGLFVGYLVRPISPTSTLGPLLKLAGTGVLVVVGVLLVAQAEKFFGVDSSSGDTVGTVLENTVERTSQGDSGFDAEPVQSPLDLPGAIVSVLLRPFPWEARNVQSLAAAMESVGLVYLAWRTRDRLRHLPALIRSQPYVAFALTYSLLFVVAFSSFGNFGILTRQRVQVFPFVLVLLALPVATARLSGARAALPRPRPRTRPIERVTR